MAGAAVVQSGTYGLFIDTGFLQDEFTLDESVLNGPDTLDGSTNFADVTFGALNVAIKRGRRDVGDQFSAGTMTFTLNDTFADGVFNPFDTLSPYYDPALAQPGLAPMREVEFVRYNSSERCRKIVCRLHRELQLLVCPGRPKHRHRVLR
jgi:hypothetical protein